MGLLSGFFSYSAVAINLEHRIEELEKKLAETRLDNHRLVQRLFVLEETAAKPELEALLAEYTKYGGVSDGYAIDRTKIRYGEDQFGPYYNYQAPRYTASEFRASVLDPQKLIWLESHECGSAPYQYEITYTSASDWSAPSVARKTARKTERKTARRSGRAQNK